MKKKIVRIIVQCVVLLAVAGLFGFVNSERLNAIVSDARVEISGDSSVHFISPEEVLQMLTDKGIPYKTVRKGDINLLEAETILRQHPAILSADAYFTVDDHFRIDIHQREPVLRIIDLLGESYYIDREGNFMPMIERYTARVPVATGYITDRFHHLNMSVADIMKNDSVAAKAITDDLYNVVMAINKDTFLTAQIDQIYVGADKEIELIPRLGPQSILIGDAAGLEDKLERLHLFFTKGLPQAGWNCYRTVNLKFNNQIICTKNTP